MIQPGQAACSHENFQVVADVDRTVTNDDAKRVISHRLHVTVHCVDCGRAMWFPGHPTGDSHRLTTTDTTGRTVSLPMAFVGERFTPDPSLPSATTRNTDLTKGQP